MESQLILEAMTRILDLGNLKEGEIFYFHTIKLDDYTKHDFKILSSYEESHGNNSAEAFMLDLDNCSIL